MNLRPISISWPLVYFFITFTFTFSFCSCHQADFTVDVAINCGSTGASAARDGRQWLGDVRPKLSPLLQLGGLSVASTAIRELDPVPHKTARISRSLFSYSFQWNPGQKIIRLHFNPTLYRGFEGFRDFFTVEAGPFTLLANFSASLTAHALGVTTFVKEFCLNIEENQQLTLTFSPETSQFIDTYAFINGVEIVSVPASLSYFDGGEIGLRVVGLKSLVYVDDSTALEIVHRLNIKQDPVPATGDFYGVFPKWAKQRAHKLKSKTWKMPVEVGFRYLIRLHLSEAGLKTAGSGGSMFKILINEMVALTSSERGNGIVLIRDYMVAMRGRKRSGKRDISISLHELADGHGVLTGFEIVKLSNADDNLASPNPLPPPHVSRSHSLRLRLRLRDLLLVLGYHNAGATVAVAVISVLSIAVHKLREISEARSTVDKHNPSATAERRCRCFSLAEIQSATRNFNGSHVIGRGGFGNVYKGHIDNGSRTVPVKRLTWWSRQGGHEFRTEIETLSKLRHRNLVSLIGYCSERQEMILVYEFMAGGTLADHLYKRGTHTGNINSPLTWKQRLNICIGTARGLDYLHTGHRVIHRDVKTTNILLDENLVAKVSDFGLAKPEDRSKSQSQSHIITRVKGTRGYLDPHYFNTQKLSRKSDTYAMGVVLLEALCGRKAMDDSLLEGEQNLRVWARDKISRGEVDQIVDSTLRGEISANSLEVFVEIAVRCLHEEPKKRPTMAQVVVQLESAVEQQESKKQAAATPNKMHPVTHEVCPDYEAIQSFEKGEEPLVRFRQLHF